MLRITQNNNSAGAKRYYSTADYFSEGQELIGRWRGQGAVQLGLLPEAGMQSAAVGMNEGQRGERGEIEKKDWDRLCDNMNPATGTRLTVRRKDERRVGYDFNFNAPKSLSLVYALTKDERLLDAFRDSVDETMCEIEAEMKTRVRVGGKNEDRTTGNLVWSEYIHFTSRPVDGVPDPSLHAHCFAFNTTWDAQELRWKAGQFGDIKRDAPYFGAVFHAKLARRMEELGLGVERTKAGWDLAGISKGTLDRFSRRTAQIEQQAREGGITDPDGKSALGAKTREKKAKGLAFADLRAKWKARMSERELANVDAVASKIGGPAMAPEPGMAAVAAEHAVDHWFTRQSTVPERTLRTEALKRGVGKASRAEIESAMDARNLLVRERGGQKIATTLEVLAEETRMLDFARRGRGVCEQFGKWAANGDALVGDSHAYTFRRKDLSDGQRRAVLHVLGSRDRVTVIRGAAGVGKTTMMTEAVEAIEAKGTCVFTFAPSTDASRGQLREDGFKDAETVAMLLKDQRRHETIRGQAIWIDEAGLLSTKDMAAVFDLAGSVDARVVLSGDRRQHGSVERGAALRLLETEAGIVPAEIKEIQRQTRRYKDLVYDLSEGRTEKAFKELDDLKWIKAVPDEERPAALAADYVKALNAGKSALVVSPTHREGDRITHAIRQKLKATGKLGKEDRVFTTLKNAHFTPAELRDPLSYRPGDVLVFHQNAKGFRKGQRVVVSDVDARGVTVRDDVYPDKSSGGTATNVTQRASAGKAKNESGIAGVKEGARAGGKGSVLECADRFQAFRTGSMQLAIGDRVRITRNGTTADKVHALNNGSVYSVKGFTPGGDVVLNNNWVVDKGYGHWTHGYVSTSYASQGKSVKRVFIAQSAESFRASSREQFYVSVSRGKEAVTIYTDDKASLLEAVKQTDERLSATELVKEQEPKRTRERGKSVIRQAMQTEVQIPTPKRERERALELERA